MQYYEIEHFHINKDTLPVLGDQTFRAKLADAIYIIPKDILDDALSNCVFLMLSEEKGVSACFIPKQLITEKSMFAFYDMFYSQNRDQQGHMILHEIAHYVLDHSDEGLSDEDYYNHKQDKEANALVDKWIDDWEKHLKALEEKTMKPWKGGD
jgi:hypothetical protein